MESLDADTETRRLSPVAIIQNGYVDLVNGPQDHGWCSGYTCQKRVSLFHANIRVGKFYRLVILNIQRLWNNIKFIKLSFNIQASWHKLMITLKTE